MVWFSNAEGNAPPLLQIPILNTSRISHTPIYTTRSSYEVAVSFTPDELAKLKARAEAQRRSVSSYVTLLVVEALGRK